MKRGSGAAILALWLGCSTPAPESAAFDSHDWIAEQPDVRADTPELEWVDQELNRRTRKLECPAGYHEVSMSVENADGRGGYFQGVRCASPDRHCAQEERARRITSPST
jgi:hypothetical protein